ncbi:histone deacetylase [Nocardia altamirensis]|uniref:histone deacetylase n=1 Tax=Nocardia altamirensis TaxID=472158 RepID=UPI0008405062|nr:histone deacetylase [Nocardia altamirensis]
MTENGECRVGTDLVWYAAYGSNMHASRLRCYLTGGTPEGGARSVPGCRDRGEPARSMPMILPGILYFATESLVWTGGRAFYDPDGPGETAARAYLLTVAQFSDIAAQEMYREPGVDLDLTEVIACGRVPLGPGRYETLSCAGSFDGYPILTCTAPWKHGDLPGNAPSPTYLRHLAAGLIESHGWTVDTTATYLATRPGAELGWTPETVASLLLP